MASERLGKYTLAQKIAVGGMAEIWLATQQGPAGFSKRLVIKRILPNLARDETFVEMFLDEARVAALLEHPNIVRISDLGTEEGSYFIAMEFIDGPDLAYVIARAAQLRTVVPQTIAARMVADALCGLDYAHNFANDQGTCLGLVHRDISPHNILINRTGVSKICDFGVAKAATSKHKTQAGATKGKFAYMSPEQIAAQSLDGRSDVFAMGIVLYELTTNKRPFGDSEELLAVTAILTQEPIDPKTVVPDYPEGLRQILHKALAKKREDRYPSARDMQEDLERFIQSTDGMIGTRDVSSYIQDLFSPHPSFWEGPGDPPDAAPRYESGDPMPWETRARTGMQPGLHERALAETEDNQPVDFPEDFKTVPTPSQGTPEAPKRIPTLNKTPQEHSPRVDPENTEPPEEEPKTQRTTPKEPVSRVSPQEIRPKKSSPDPEPLVVVFPSQEKKGKKGLATLAVVAGVLLLLLALGGVATYKVMDDAGMMDRTPPDAGALHAPDAGTTTETGSGHTETQPKAGQKGAVAVTASPAADVFLGGQKKGRTPLTLSLPEGSHTLEFRDHKSGIFKRTKVLIQAGKTLKISETFEFGIVKLKLPSSGTFDVWVDGAPHTGDMAVDLSLSSGEHTIALKDILHNKNLVKKVQVKAGEVREVSFQ